jgi:hypothetical protein
LLKPTSGFFADFVTGGLLGDATDLIVTILVVVLRFLVVLLLLLCFLVAADVGPFFITRVSAPCVDVEVDVDDGLRIRQLYWTFVAYCWGDFFVVLSGEQ